MTKQNEGDDPLAEPERDPWFNPYRYTASDRATIVLGGVLHRYEKTEGRERNRKIDDRETFWKVGYALLADLSYHYLRGSPGTGLVVTRTKGAFAKRKRTRYDPPFLTRTFPKFLDDFAEHGYLTQTKGVYSGLPGKSKRTTIKAGPALVALINENGFGFDDFGLSEDEEVIILKRPKADYWDEGGLQDYEDTPLTKRFRAQVKAINSWLAAADISFDPEAHDQPVDPRARRLFRYFAEGQFEKGGRLFRGFWENLPKAARLSGITIEGERVIGLDYSQLNPTLAYAEAECSPPPGDAYALVGFESNREGVKKVFNALLFDKGPRDRFPKKGNAKKKVKDLFPPKTKIGDVIQAIHEKHPKLASVLSKGMGFHLMFLESEIMMHVLEQLRERGIVGLPVFDAVIVKAPKAEEATAVMKNEFRKATGLEIQVRLEHPLGTPVSSGPRKSD